MRILFLAHSFNSLAQRLFVELTEAGHEVSVELDINDAVTTEAVALFRPELVVAPFLKRAIPEAVWRRYPCIVLHPGIVGDRGPSALDWAIMNGEGTWGVTALQANEVMDGGDVWASTEFPMRAARKSSLYRHEVTEAAVHALRLTMERMADPGYRPHPLDYNDANVRGRLRPLMRQDDRRIDWTADDTSLVLCKLRAADGFPGVLDRIGGADFRLFHGVAEDRLRGRPGDLLARRDGAVCRATRDGAVWITHLAPLQGEFRFKLPAVQALGEAAAELPEDPVGILPDPGRSTLQEIRYEERSAVGYLHFDFYNGAMGTGHCKRLLAAYRYACGRDTRVIVLMGGRDFWCNGLHLNLIEAADSPADESWRNINAMDDLAREIIVTDDRLILSAMQGNAGAGGVFLALTADRVIARDGVVLNPHYKGMGNLYGSEYWTYLLPRRVGAEAAAALTENRLPVGAQQALRQGLLDQVGAGNQDAFLAELHRTAVALAENGEWARRVEQKRCRRLVDEATKPLDSYREEELAQMRLNFYGFDPSYHVARYNFVHRRPHSWTPLHLARHRRRAPRAA